MDALWRIEMLGRLAAIQEDTVITRFRTQKTATLLAYLACHCQRSHSRETLIELFWPEYAPPAGRNYLSKALSSLRHQLEPPGVPAGTVVTADRFQVQLNPAAIVTDVGEFESVLDAVQQTNALESITGLKQAVNLYQGAFLTGCYDNWAVNEQRRLAERYFLALRSLSRALQQSDALEASLLYVRRAVMENPLHEAAQEELIRLLAAVGQPSAAQQQYQEWERILHAEVGESPSASLHDLIAALPSDAEMSVPREVLLVPQTALPALPSADDNADRVRPASFSSDPRHRPRLPLQFTRFFGRERELQTLRALLPCPAALPSARVSEAEKGATDAAIPVRLVTLTGIGGSGKTRLAIEAARLFMGVFNGAVWFVSLAEVTEVERLSTALVNALPLSPLSRQEPLEQVITLLADQPALLILDNFEQLLDNTPRKTKDGADMVRELLERAPFLVVLVTSRQRLDLEGEQELPVAPLDAPLLEAGNSPRLRMEAPTPAALIAYPSVQLFVDRTQRLRPDFQLTPRNMLDVACLCARLEGLPLAIELAAARGQVMTPAQMLTQLEHRFEFLVSRRRDMADRHRTLRGMIDWSCQLLSPPLQRIFAQLSLFRGGWSEEAAEYICETPDILDALTQLRECSLIRTEETVGEMRFGMLDTLREYAAEQLMPEERVEAARRHAAYYLQFAHAAEVGTQGEQQALWLDRLEAEHDNFRMALTESFTAQDGVYGLRLAGAMWRFWMVRGHLREGRAWLEKLTARFQTGESTPERAEALMGAGILARNYGDFVPASGFLEESLAINRALGNGVGCARALGNLGITAREQGDSVTARQLLRESINLFRSEGEKRLLASFLVDLAHVEWAQGHREHARDLLQESLTLHRELKHVWGIALAASTLASVAAAQEDYAFARALYEESLPLWRTLDDRRGIAATLNHLGLVACKQKDFHTARTLLTASLAAQDRQDKGRNLADVLQNCVVLAEAQGLTEQAIGLMGAAEALREAAHYPAPPFARTEKERLYSVLHSAVDEERFDAFWQAGHALSMEQAIARAQQEILSESLS